MVTEYDESINRFIALLFTWFIPSLLPNFFKGAIFAIHLTLKPFFSIFLDK